MADKRDGCSLTLWSFVVGFPFGLIVEQVLARDAIVPGGLFGGIIGGLLAAFFATQFRLPEDDVEPPVKPTNQSPDQPGGLN
jgi:hypothetical protein